MCACKFNATSIISFASHYIKNYVTSLLTDTEEYLNSISFCVCSFMPILINYFSNIWNML